MNAAKRAALYLLRKKEKTVSLFLLVWLTAVFLVSCFRILNASECLSGDIRASLGAAFYIRGSTVVSVNEKGETEVEENGIHLSQSEIDEIMERGDIKYCNPINYGFVKSDSIDFIPGEKYSEASNMGKATALRFSALAAPFLDERAVLAEGEHITAGDTGEILISQQLAEANHLSVGDIITLTHAKPGERDGEYIDEIPVKTVFADVRISGIYRLTEEESSVAPTPGMAGNEIYVSLDVLNDLQESEIDIYTGEVDFYIADPAKLEDITRSVQLLSEIDWSTHFIRVNDFHYDKIADQLSSLGDLVKILLVCVSAVSTAVLTLLLTLRMRGRLRETGILLAAGIPKGQILVQFLMEVFAVSLAAWGLSYLASFEAAKHLGNGLIHGLQPALVNKEALETGSSQAGWVKAYLKLGRTETAIIYLCQLGAVMSSTLASSVTVMRRKPKEILSKMS